MKLARVMMVACTAAVGMCLLSVGASAQGPARLPLPLEPFGDADEAVFPAFEGWGEAQDGSGYFIVLGYKNRNRTQTLEIPIGPNNRIEPGGPDYGQPTVFEPGRQTSVFAIKVPKDFGTKKLTWTLVANGQSAVVTFHLNPYYKMSFYKEEANGNEPPRLKFTADAPMISGPSVDFVQTLSAKAGQPMALKVWVSDSAPTEKNWEGIISAQNRPKSQPVLRSQVAIVDGQVIGLSGREGRNGASTADSDLTVVWQKVRGLGTVTIMPPRVPLVTKGNRTAVLDASAMATFSKPGEYVLRVEPVEAEDGFDGLCCFTFANVKVIVQ